MRALKNPLAKWSAGTEYKGLHRGADKAEIRAHLWEILDEAEEASAGSGQGFASNQEEKAAVEQHAMAVARVHYEAADGRKMKPIKTPACTTGSISSSPVANISRNSSSPLVTASCNMSCIHGICPVAS